MNVSEFLRSFLMTFIASIVVTIILWFFFYSMHVDYLPYVAALLGMYVFAGYGINCLINDKTIDDGASRFILAIVYILIYSVAFIYIMPMVFGPNVFPQPLNLVNYGINFDMNFTTEMILAIFGLIMLVLNYLDFKK